MSRKRTERVLIVRLGRTRYEQAWNLQKKLFDLRSNGTIGDTFLLNEHEHVYTIGKSSDGNHLLADASELKARGAEVFYNDRGGDITYHGPGQLVGYPILDLNNYYLDLHRYLHDLEEIIIRVLADFHLTGRRDAGFTGVWVGNEKIAAIGVKVSRWITMHGFALNVNTDLTYFDRIIPCGIFHKGVTSMQRLLGREVLLDEVTANVCRHFGEVFGVRVEECEEESFMRNVYQASTEGVHIQ